MGNMNAVLYAYMLWAFATPCSILCLRWVAPFVRTVRGAGGSTDSESLTLGHRAQPGPGIDPAHFGEVGEVRSPGISGDRQEGINEIIGNLFPKSL
jgi:hypothetical protein